MNKTSVITLVSCMLMGIRSVAGDLTVEGDLNVTSNLTARSIAVTNMTAGTLAVEGAAVFSGPLFGDGSAITNLSGAHLVPGSVGAGSLAAGAVSADKIPAGAISGAHIAADAAIAPSRIAGLTAGLAQMEASISNLTAQAATSVNRITSSDDRYFQTIENGTGMVYRIITATSPKITFTEDFRMSWGTPPWSEREVPFGEEFEPGDEWRCWAEEGGWHLSFGYAYYAPYDEYPTWGEYAGLVFGPDLPQTQPGFIDWQTPAGSATFWPGTLAATNLVAVFATAQQVPEINTLISTQQVPRIWDEGGHFCQTIENGTGMVRRIDVSTNLIITFSEDFEGFISGHPPWSTHAVPFDFDSGWRCEKSGDTYTLGTGWFPYEDDYWEWVYYCDTVSGPLPLMFYGCDFDLNPKGTATISVGSLTYTTNLVAVFATAQQLAQTEAGLTEHTGRADNPHGVTAAQVGAYTTGQTDAAIAGALSGFNPGSCIQTNHSGDVAINGNVSASSLMGNGAGITNLNLAAYAGSNLTWDAVSNKLNAAAGGASYTDADAVSAVTAGDLNMNANRVTGLADAAADTDAVNRQTMQAAIQAALLNVGPFGDVSMGSFTTP